MNKKKRVRNTCGKRVKMLRVGKDMKQTDLAAELSVMIDLDLSQRSISMLESGSRFVKDIEILALAELFDVHPMYLMFGDKIPAKYA